jgi:hypothetical protein
MLKLCNRLSPVVPYPAAQASNARISAEDFFTSSFVSVYRGATRSTPPADLQMAYDDARAAAIHRYHQAVAHFTESPEAKVQVGHRGW